MTEQSTCRWEYDDNCGMYNTECGETLFFGAGRLQDNPFYPCPKCGREIVEMKP